MKAARSRLRVGGRASQMSGAEAAERMSVELGCCTMNDSHSTTTTATATADVQQPEYIIPLTLIIGGGIKTAA